MIQVQGVQSGDAKMDAAGLIPQRLVNATLEIP